MKLRDMKSITELLQQNLWSSLEKESIKSKTMSSTWFCLLTATHASCSKPTSLIVASKRASEAKLCPPRGCACLLQLTQVAATSLILHVTGPRGSAYLLQLTQVAANQPL